ncbi:MAG: hypothetical protein K2X66_14215, partial [Cyanobacteria bacterium]|nr:hypothetical protein [Cyanobacteriota bacterium]
KPGVLLISFVSALAFSVSVGSFVSAMADTLEGISFQGNALVFDVAPDSDKPIETPRWNAWPSTIGASPTEVFVFDFPGATASPDLQVSVASTLAKNPVIKKLMVRQTANGGLRLFFERAHSGAGKMNHTPEFQISDVAGGKARLYFALSPDTKKNTLAVEVPQKSMETAALPPSTKPSAAVHKNWYPNIEDILPSDVSKDNVAGADSEDQKIVSNSSISKESMPLRGVGRSNAGNKSSEKIGGLSKRSSKIQNYFQNYPEKISLTSAGIAQKITTSRLVSKGDGRKPSAKGVEKLLGESDGNMTPQNSGKQTKEVAQITVLKPGGKKNQTETFNLVQLVEEQNKQIAYLEKKLREKPLQPSDSAKVISQSNGATGFIRLHSKPVETAMASSTKGGSSPSVEAELRQQLQIALSDAENTRRTMNLLQSQLNDLKAKVAEGGASTQGLKTSGISETASGNFPQDTPDYSKMPGFPSVKQVPETSQGKKAGASSNNEIQEKIEVGPDGLKTITRTIPLKNGDKKFLGLPVSLKNPMALPFSKKGNPLTRRPEGVSSLAPGEDITQLNAVAHPTINVPTPSWMNDSGGGRAASFPYMPSDTASSSQPDQENESNGSSPAPISGESPSPGTTAGSSDLAAYKDQLRKVMVENPRNPRPYWELKNIYTQEGNYPEASNVLENL